MSNFIGRKHELKLLEGLFHKSSASLVTMKGRRRIGKSRLVEEFAKGKKLLRFSGIPLTEGTTAQDQRDVFAKQLSTNLDMPNFTVSNWGDLFTLLARNIQEEKTVILFDEISWMGSKDSAFLGLLKNAWDMQFSQNSKLVIVLCGSISTWIEQNIIRSTGFYGRISLYIKLEELSLSESNEFLDMRGFRGSVYEKFKILSVIGGVPWYLEQIQPKLNADDNIYNLCLTKNSLLLNEFDLIFHDLFGSKGLMYKKIIEFLADGSAELNDIAKATSYPQSGALSEYLENLIESAFISRDFTWMIKDGKFSRLSQFRLSDNYMRFYLKYIAPNKPKIFASRFEGVGLAAMPEWNTVMGLQFENLVLKNRSRIIDILGIRGQDIVADNPFFQRKTVKQKGCQIDYMIQTRFNTMFACEVKFSKSELKSDVIVAMKEKLSRIIIPKGFACNPVLIHVNGLDETALDQGYFVEVIDFGALLYNF